MLNHGTGINRVSSKLSPPDGNYHLREAWRSRAHGAAALSRVQCINVRSPRSYGYRTLKDYRLIIAMYSDGIDGDESGIGNLLLVAVMSCIDPSAVQTARPVFDAQNHVYAYAHKCIHARALNMYLNVVRCLSIKLLVHECRRITPEPDRACMEMSKFSVRRKQSKCAPLTSGGIPRSRESRRIKLYILRETRRSS